MTAILLAAGVGRRMGADAKPKCLLTVGGESLLRRMLNSLIRAGVDEVVLVVGFRKEEVAEEARDAAAGLRLTLVENLRFREGAILSLWSAKEFLDRDLLVMDADVLCPPELLERLLRSPHPNSLLVDGTAVDTGEEQRVFGREGRVLHITKRPSESIRNSLKPLGESLGFLKLSGEGARRLKSLLEENLSAGIVNIEHEQVYPALFQQLFVGFERADGFPWTEIDTPEDLERAAREIFPRWALLKCFNRRLSDRFLPWISRFPFTPNQWTLAGLALGLASLAFLSAGGAGPSLLGAALFQLFYLTDNWDGDIARLKGRTSRFGAWLDLWVDAGVQSLLPAAIAAGLLQDGAPEWVRWVGGAASAGVAMDFAVTLWGGAKGFGPADVADRTREAMNRSGSWGSRRLQTELTHENFSLLIAAVLLLGLQVPFLAATAVGSQIFWVRFLWKARGRLIECS